MTCRVTADEAQASQASDLRQEVEERACELLYEHDSDCHDFADALECAAEQIVEDGQLHGRWDADSWDDRIEMQSVRELGSRLTDNALDAHPEWLLERAIRAVQCGAASNTMDGIRLVLRGPRKFRRSTQQAVMRLAAERGLLTAMNGGLWAANERGAA